MIFIGDIHGNFSTYCKLLQKHPDSIQLGDMGIGFSESLDAQFPDEGNHRWIRGNHDNPDVCKTKKTYLGDYGVTDEGIFFVSGGYSIDRMYRTIGIDWWEGEELSRTVFQNEVIPLYGKVKPEVVISHDAPLLAYPYIISEIYSKFIKCDTNIAFDEMFKIHQPRIWIHAHFHISNKYEIGSTTFHSLGINECKDVELG